MLSRKPNLRLKDESAKGTGRHELRCRWKWRRILHFKPVPEIGRVCQLTCYWELVPVFRRRFAGT